MNTDNWMNWQVSNNNWKKADERAEWGIDLDQTLMWIDPAKTEWWIRESD